MMAVRVCVLDNEYMLKSMIGNISDEEIQEVVHQATILNLKCLYFICAYDDTYFNYLQVLSIKKEISSLRKSSIISKTALDVIEAGTDIILANELYYLQFYSD